MKGVSILRKTVMFLLTFALLVSLFAGVTVSGAEETASASDKFFLFDFGPGVNQQSFPWNGIYQNYSKPGVWNPSSPGSCSFEFQPSGSQICFSEGATFSNYVLQDGDVIQLRYRFSNLLLEEGSQADPQFNLKLGVTMASGTDNMKYFTCDALPIKESTSWQLSGFSVTDPSLIGGRCGEIFLNFVGSGSYATDVELDFIYIGPDSLAPVYGQQSISTGSDSEDDSFVLTMDAMLNGIEETRQPIDLTIVMDRSASMSFPSKNGQVLNVNSLSNLQLALNKLDREKGTQEGYYRATVWMRNGKASVGREPGFPCDGFACWMPMRYYNGQWQVLNIDCYNNGNYDRQFGIIIWERPALAMKYTQWISAEDAMAVFNTRRDSSNAPNKANYSFQISTLPMLSAATDAVTALLQQLNATTQSLPEGMCHRVSVLSYGMLPYIAGSTYSVDGRTMVLEDLGVSSPSVRLDMNLSALKETLQNPYCCLTSRVDLALKTLTENSRFLPPAEPGRKRVVLVVTDGTPSASTGYSVSTAESSLTYARQLKQQGTEIICLGFDPELNAEQPYNAAWNPTSDIYYEDTRRISNASNNFLNLLSSNYPDAQGGGGSLQPGEVNSLGRNYYFSDDGITTNVNKLCAAMIPDAGSRTRNPLSEAAVIKNSVLKEFEVEEIRVYAQPYQGDGAFGTKQLIAGYGILSDPAKESFGNSLCKINLTETEEGTKEIEVIWTDYLNAHLTESYSLVNGTQSSITKGYKLVVELELCVDRENTLGGNHIPVTGDTAGIYSGSANAMIVGYAVPYLNIRAYQQIDLYHSLDLVSDISIHYLVPARQLEEAQQIRMRFRYCGQEIEAEGRLNGNFYYFTFSGIIATQMTETVEATVYWQKDGQSYYSDTDQYSVSTYAYSQLSKTNAPDSLKSICADLLRYGAAAQIYKDYKTDELADARLTEEQKAYLTNLESIVIEDKAQAMGDLENGYPWLGKTLLLDSKVAVKAVFDLESYSGDLAALNLRVSYTNHAGEERSLLVSDWEVYNEEEKLYSFTVDSLVAADMRSVLSMALYEGDVQISETQLYSVESYCAGKTGSLGELCKSLMAYSDAAKAYFAN